MIPREISLSLSWLNVFCTVNIFHGIFHQKAKFLALKQLTVTLIPQFEASNGSYRNISINGTVYKTEGFKVNNLMSLI